MTLAAPSPSFQTILDDSEPRNSFEPHVPLRLDAQLPIAIESRNLPMMIAWALAPTVVVPEACTCAPSRVLELPGRPG
jgi:hypothetical protein